MKLISFIDLTTKLGDDIRATISGKTEVSVPSIVLAHPQEYRGEIQIGRIPDPSEILLDTECGNLLICQATIKLTISWNIPKKWIVTTDADNNGDQLLSQTDNITSDIIKSVIGQHTDEWLVAGTIKNVTWQSIPGILNISFDPDIENAITTSRVISTSGVPRQLHYTREVTLQIAY